MFINLYRANIHTTCSFLRESFLFNELIVYAYVEMTDLRETWLEQSLINKEQNCVSKFHLILHTFLMAASNATRYANFSIAELSIAEI